MEKQLVVLIGAKTLAVLEGVPYPDGFQVARYKKILDPQGFRLGVISDLGEAAASLQSLLEEFYDPKSQSIEHEIHCILGTSKVHRFEFQTSSYFKDAKTITPFDVQKAVAQTKAVATIPMSEMIILAQPKDFLVDDVEHVKNPLGLDAKRLGVCLEMFASSSQEIKNIQKLFMAIGAEASSYFPKPIGLHEALLSEDERRDSTVIVDIMNHTIQYTFIRDFMIQFMEYSELGFYELNKKIAAQYGIDDSDAELLKCQYGTLAKDKVDELIPLIQRNGVGVKQIKRSEFQDFFDVIFKEWSETMVAEIRTMLDAYQIKHPQIILAGGAARLDHLDTYFLEKFSLSARCGVVKKVKAVQEVLLDPVFTPALGFLKWKYRQETEQKPLLETSGFFRKTFSSAVDWFQTYF